MSSDLIVFDSPESRERCLEDHVRFLTSVEKLSNVGIIVRSVLISSADDLDPSSEAYEMMVSDGPSILPLTVYDGVVIETYEYPSDKVLVDYLEVPDGILKAERTRQPAANDMPCVCWARNTY
ncbi:MAG: arsenic metallochaperone ArsD family protein [archaeon]|nr:arsenic metallochaperone ArsD family protein [archaeon]